MDAVQPTSPASLIPTGWSPQPTAAAQQYWVDPATGATVDAWGNPVGVAAPAAWSSPATAWSPTPAAQAGQGAANVTSGSMLDAIANAMLGIPTTVTGAVAPSPAAAVDPRVAVAATFGAVTAAPAQTVQTLARRARAATASTVGVAARGFASATGGAATAAVRGARRVGTEIWAGVRNPRAIHVSQVPSKYNLAPAPSNQDCGPVSVVMSLKLLGLAIPGIAQGAAPQRLVNRVRQLSGNVRNTASTTNQELERALGAAGATVREITDFASIRAAVLSGKPVILNGNPGNGGAYGARFSAAQMTPFNGAHWILVSGYDSRTGQFIINDPLSKVGPVKVSPSQLEAYRAGSMGIEVAR